MFTPKNIQGALEELYDLCDPDYMVDMLVNYSEEFDDISPALLAKSFQKNAEMISEYRVLSSAGEGIDYQGKVLLNSRAVRLLSYVEDMSGDEKVRTIQSKELWLCRHSLGFRWSKMHLKSFLIATLVGRIFPKCTQRQFNFC